MTIEDEELQNLKDRVSKQKGARALASPVYFMAQQVAIIVSLNIIFPALLNLKWQGDFAQQALFVFVYAITYSITGLLFLAISAFFAITLEGLKVLQAIKTGQISLQAAAQNIPYQIMTGSHPKWLIALAPPIVPMLTLAFLSLFFKDNLNFEDGILLIKACALQGLLSYLISLPFILKAQKALYEVVHSENEKSNESS